MIPTFVRRASEQKSNSYIEENQYKAKRLWPPDFSKLSTKHQFRLERRYKRRSQLKFRRPGWIKGVKLAQFGTMTFALVYGVFFIDWKQPNQPFHGLRTWFNNISGTEWAPTNETILRQRQRELAAENNSPIRADITE